MCNIAGYAGEKRAAPILIEMIRKQQNFDGGCCAGIATVHNGRLYYRKVVGDIETLVNTTDALYLPGNVGIAHTRPGGKPVEYSFAHPFITMDESMAGIENGTNKTKNHDQICQEITTAMENEGYVFRENSFVENSRFPKLLDGSYVNASCTRVMLADKYIKQGMDIPAALARASEEIYADIVLSVLNVATADRFYALRTTRPAVSLKSDDGTYLATTRFAFPEDAEGEVKMLPLFQTCEISKDGVTVTDAKMTKCEAVSEITDYTLEEAYHRICKMLKGQKENPLNFDDLEVAVGKQMRDLFPGEHTLVQDARVVYDVLYRLEEEGLLKKEIRIIKGYVKRYYMWID